MIYSIPAMVALAQKAGFQGQDAAIMAAIAQAESAGDPNAINHDPNGTTDYGLTQINTVHDKDHGSGWAEAAIDPTTAFSEAFTVFMEARNSFSPWVTYQRGIYLQFLPQAQAALGTAPAPTPTPAPVTSVNWAAIKTFLLAIGNAFVQLSQTIA